jgi:sugar (pentulose or hexulose) kinase
VHANNCTSDLNAWVGLFREFAETFGFSIDTDKLFTGLFNEALKGEADCGGLLAYNYFSGEPIVHLEKGAPLFVRTAESQFSLANFMRTHLYSSLGTLKLGMEILFDKEKVKVDQVLGHGGFFKTPKVGQQIMAAAINAPVSVMETAGEGGPWGMALLAAYLVNKKPNETLEAYLNEKVFASASSITVSPEATDVAGFNTFMSKYRAGLTIEEKAVKVLA